MRWLPGDLLGLPVLLTGLGFLVGLDVVTNRVADGPWTVRVLLASPARWLAQPLGWIGLALVLMGATLSILARQLADPYRWGTAVRYWPFRVAAWALLLGAVLSMWLLSDHVTDPSSGGLEWRFVARPRTRWGNDLTTIVLAVAALACLVLSFGRRRLRDFEAADQARRERVPSTTAAKARTSSTMPAGVTTQSRSVTSASPPDNGS